MAELSAAQLLDIRADLGDDGTVWTDDELDRLYTRASSDYNSAVVLAIRQLLMNAAKLHDYSLAQSSESKSQIFKNLKEMLTYWDDKASTRQQVKMVGMRSVPPRAKDSPNETTRVEDWSDA
jgi:hypothetical protein